MSPFSKKMPCFFSIKLSPNSVLILILKRFIDRIQSNFNNICYSPDPVQYSPLTCFTLLKIKFYFYGH